MARSVLLTGASSFVGCHLALAFAAAGWEVVAVHSRQIESYDGIKRSRLKLVAESSTLLQADLCDPGAAMRLVDAVSPALWVQQAGFTDGYASNNYQLGVAHTVNVMSLFPIYAALAGSACGLIITGSSMEYSTSRYANKEDDACWPETLYGLSKLTETLLARQLAHRHAVPTRIARLYIPFGRFDNPRKLLPSVVDALAKARPIELSTCDQKRDFVAVEDVAAGYLRLALDLPRTMFDIFNLCRGEAIRLKDLLANVARSIDADPQLLRFGAVSMGPGEPDVSFGDASKARDLLNWTARPLTPSLGLV